MIYEFLIHAFWIIYVGVALLSLIGMLYLYYTRHNLVSHNSKLYILILPAAALWPIAVPTFMYYLKDSEK